ncbi:MAG: TDT family transporter [Actinomycetia bacterium]|nr:TDT family transporter [Actinomycetes bacterium]
MGTGIVATAAVTLPFTNSLVQWFAYLVWLGAAVLLLGLITASIRQWLRHPELARGHLTNPMMAQFYGAPPMALMTVGTGALLVQKPLLGDSVSLGIAWSLWIIGTIGGLVTAVVVPYLLFTRHQVRKDGAFGGWLMPVVPPMVSAAGGALLVPYAPAGAVRETMLYGCYALFGLSLMAAFIIITLIWSRLAHFGSSGSARVPTLWIVLGPLGQSITAAGALGTNAKTAVEPQLAAAMDVFAIIYGVPVWGFAILWACLATLLTLRARKQNMSFALTWWAFTFPVGTCVTGTSQLAFHTDLITFKVAAMVAYLGLLLAWLLVLLRTTRGIFRGPLLTPAPLKQPPARKAE